ncbi:hypothetical protein [uncultured Methylobacterium sp.]|uniref:hypothetical protein n=1 Tax=uncultured Methylobacterium sp. TaxID=157278 RepID=UPI0025896CAE|nr:hypothetical protein [uncultured Methylobacterium sp.]
MEEVVEHLPLPHPHNDDHGNDSIDGIEKVQAKSRRGLASWDDAGDLPRVIAVNRALATFGRPFAVSLNFSPEIIQKALNDNRGPLNYVRRAVARNLKRVLGSDRPFWLALETDDEGRLHAHGGIALNDNDDPRRVKEIHAEAGGNWKRSGSAPAFLRDQRDYDDPDGWAVYPFKRHARTRRAIREAAGLPADAPVTLWSCTDDIRTEGKRIHESARRAAQVARKRPIAVEVPQTTPDAAAPVSESLDAPASASRSNATPTASRVALPIPVIVIRATTIALVTNDDQFQLLAVARSRGPPGAESVIPVYVPPEFRRRGSATGGPRLVTPHPVPVSASSPGLARTPDRRRGPQTRTARAGRC